MSESDIVIATFTAVRNATAAVDWFRNQRVDPQAISIMALPPGEQARPTQPGDNRRTDLAWQVSIDLRRSGIDRRVAVETMRREGGSVARRRASSEAVRNSTS
jgi:hypothetical protein